MATCRSIIEQSLWEIGGLTRGAPLVEEDGTQGLFRLQAMLASWQRDGLKIDLNDVELDPFNDLTLDGELAVPDGYLGAIITNLGVVLAISYGVKEGVEALRATALADLASIGARNSPQSANFADNSIGKIVDEAFRDLGVLHDGMKIDQVQLDRGMKRFSEMLDEWALDGLLIPAKLRITHTVTIAKDLYLIGLTDEDPDIEVTRPFVAVDIVNYKWYGHQQAKPIQSTSELHVSATKIDYIPEGKPSLYYYQNTLDGARIEFDQKSTVGDEFEMIGPTYLDDVNALGADFTAIDEFSIARGYWSALVKNLAKELLPSYKHRNVSERSVEMAAMDSKIIIERYNNQPLVAELDKAFHRRNSNMQTWRNGSY